MSVTYVLRSDKFGTLKLEHLPIGWDKLKRTMQRSRTWHSVASTYTQELEFVRDGADYLTNAYERQGIDAEVYLDIYKMDGQDMSNRLWFQSRIDFTTYSRDYKGQVKVETEQVSFAKKLVNGEKVKVDLTSLQPLEGEATLGKLPYKNIALHSKAILKSTQAILDPDADYPFAKYEAGFLHNEVQYVDLGWTIPATKFVAAEIQDFYPRIPGVLENWKNGYDITLPTSTIENSDLVLIEFKEAGNASIDIDIDAVYKISFRGRASVGKIFLRLVKVDQAGTQYIINKELASFNLQNEDTAVFRTLNISVKYPLSNLEFKVGDKLYWYIFTEHECFNMAEVHEIVWNKANFSIHSLTKTEGTTGQGIYFADAFARTIESLTGEVGSFDSNYYSTTDGYHSKGVDTIPGRRLLSNGIHVRGWGFDEKPMTVTLADMLETAYALDAVGLEMKLTEGKWQAVAKPVKEFYRDDQVIDLGTVSKLYKKVDAEKYYNEVRIGYDKFDTDSTNSLDEFNGSREYKTCIAQQKAEYRAVAPFRADGYGIETARRQSREAAPNKSTSYDKDTFLICFKRIGESIVSERGDILQNSSNLIDPATVYNVRISPARLFKRHEHLFSGCLQKEPDKEVRFTTGEVNVEMTSKLMSETATVRESASTLNEALAKPILLPETYEFEKRLTDEQISLLEAQPHSTILFNGGKAGYLQNVEIGFNGLAKFTLSRKHIDD